MATPVLYRAIWIPSAVLLAGMVTLYSVQPEAIPSVGESKTFTTEDRSITVEHPANWKPRQLSMNSVLTQVEFEPSRSVHIVIKSDLQGSLMADMSKAAASTGSGMTDAQGNLLPGMEQREQKQKTPLEKLHAAQGAAMETEYAERHYEEGETKPTKVGSVEALTTDFTFEESGLFGKKQMAGKRVTALGGERRLTIIATCPKEAVSSIGKAFDSIIESVEMGQPGG